MTIEDEFLELKEKSDDLLEVVCKTFKIDVLCDKIDKLLKVWRDR